MCPRTSLATCLNAAPAKQSGPAELQATSASLRATPPSGQAELQATSASGPAVLQATSASGPAELQATSASGPAVLQATSAILPAILPETLAIGPATPARPWAALQRALATFSERDVTVKKSGGERDFTRNNVHNWVSTRNNVHNWVSWARPGLGFRV